MKQLKIGSVKDIYELEDLTQLMFKFSDRYSILDWGRMPDDLEGKSKVLAFMSGFFFELFSNPTEWKKWFEKGAIDVPTYLKEKIEKNGIHSHFISCLDKNGKFCDLLNVENSVVVNKVKVPKVEFVNGEYDYAYYEEKRVDCLVPLEIIFRHGIPQGSSLLKRATKDYLKEIGIEGEISQGDIFEKPVVEFSTKLEKTDRYISLSEAQKISGMNKREVDLLKSLVVVLSARLKDFFESIGIQLWDGKFEFAFILSEKSAERDFVLVDSIGPDELRLTKNGVHLSKEILRQYYKDSLWEKSVAEAKKLAKEKGIADWKSLCKENPELLSKGMKQNAEFIYKSLCNRISQEFLNKKLFENVTELEELTENL